MSETETTTSISIDDFGLLHWIFEWLPAAQPRISKYEGPEKNEYHRRDGLDALMSDLASGSYDGEPMLKDVHYKITERVEVCNTSAECIDFEYDGA